MESIEIWLYRALLIAGISLLIWLAQQVKKKVEKLTFELEKLNLTFSLQDKDMKYFHSNCIKREREVNKILDDHEKRIRKVEE